MQGAAGPQPAGGSGLLWYRWSISAHGSPLGSGRRHGSLLSGHRHGRSPQAVDPAQDRGEHGARHPYELYLALNDIEHRKTRVGTPRTNGFVERFHGTVLEEFFRLAMHARLYESVAALQADLDAWLQHYNHERPHLGYRNQGRRLWETIEQFVRQGG